MAATKLNDFLFLKQVVSESFLKLNESVEVHVNNKMVTL